MFQAFSINFFRRKSLHYWLIAAFGVESFCVTYGLHWPELVPFLTVVYPIMGLIIALGFILLPKAAFALSIHKTMTPIGIKRRLVAILLKTIALIYFSIELFRATPLSIDLADMLPIMKIMATRFCNGHIAQVYDKIPEIWGGIQPIYLPAMWMPFAIPVALHIDMRWVTVGGLFLAFSLFLTLIRPFKRPYPVALLSIIATLFFWWLFKADLYNFIPLTEEGIVVGYYSLLVLSLLNGNYWLIGISIALCTLSRYSFIGWIPAFAIYLLLEKKWKAIGQITLGGCVTVLLLCIVPFGWKPIQLIAALPKEYINFSKRVWEDSYDFFFETMGFAKFFGPERIALQHSLLVYCSFILPSLFVVICMALKNKYQYKMHNIPLASLKLALVVFYNLIDVPYLYLFYTSSFISLLGLAYFVSIPDHHFSEEMEMEAIKLG